MCDNRKIGVKKERMKREEKVEDGKKYFDVTKRYKSDEEKIYKTICQRKERNFNTNQN